MLMYICKPIVVDRMMIIFREHGIWSKRSPQLTKTMTEGTTEDTSPAIKQLYLATTLGSSEANANFNYKVLALRQTQGDTRLP